MAAARYRDRHTVTRRKSDHLDAMVLANILRTDKTARRTLPNDSELVQAIAVLARAQQDVVWDRIQAGNKLRSHLREYFPGLLVAFQHTREGVSSNVARAVLAAALTPETAAELTRAQLRSLLKKAGLQRGIEAESERLRDALRVPQMRQLPQVEQAMGRQTVALPRQLDAVCTGVADLTEATAQSFDTHPDAEIITSFPGPGSLTGARVLAEIGDDRSRFTDAKGLKAFAGVDAIATDLEASPRIEYQHSRQCLAGWTLTPAIWNHMVAQLQEWPGNQAITDDRKRRTVPALPLGPASPRTGTSSTLPSIHRNRPRSLPHPEVPP